VRFAVEQQVKSGLRDLYWLRVAGSFDTRAEAERVMTRLARREFQLRIVENAG
jgi:hypothetical protein